MGSTLTVDNIVGATTAANVKMPAGHIIQFVNVTSTTLHNHSSTSFTDTGFDATITPKYATSKIFILGNFSIYLSGGSQNNLGELQIRRNDVDVRAFMTVRQYDYGSSGVLIERPVTMVNLDSPATTSAVKYTLYTKARQGGGNIILNDDSDDFSTLTLMEVAQ